MINTVDAFIKICKTSSKDEIYNIFENDCADEVRNKIYELADEDSPEPFRSAMEWLGIKV